LARYRSPSPSAAADARWRKTTMAPKNLAQQQCSYADAESRKVFSMRAPT
jgi:hypothetical protein